MAKKTVTVLVDDLDGTELPSGTRSTTFAVNGTEYEIDLGPDNVARLDEALSEFIRAGRRTTGAPSPKARASSGSGKTPEYLARVRVWASANGHPVAERGRVKREVLDAFESAQNGSSDEVVAEPAQDAQPHDEQPNQEQPHDEQPHDEDAPQGEQLWRDEHSWQGN